MLAFRQAAFLVTGALVLLAASPSYAGNPAAMDRHYVVELDEAATAVEDPGAVAAELARTYGGQLNRSPSARIHGFEIAMTAEQARLLTADPRVKGVHETTPPATAPVRRIIANDVLPPVTFGPYKYDGAGNIIHMGTDRYTYDEMSRITSGTAVIAQNSDTQQFEYDGFGNLKKVTVPNKSTVYIDADPATNRLQNASGSETGANVLHLWAGNYDAAGNQMSASGTPSYLYDSMNMLSEMTTPRHEFYLYDANDERVATVGYTDPQNTVWRYTLRDEGNHVLRTVTDTILSGVHSWQQTEDYVYRTGGLLVAITPQGSTETRKHFHLDHLGSAVLITDDNGQRVSSHKYWPFGAEAPGSDTDGERMKFTGHERDLDPFGTNGLDYMHARYYSASTGRFLSIDRFSGQVASPQSWNRYSYALSNPLRMFDPDGNAPRESRIIHVVVNVVYSNADRTAPPYVMHSIRQRTEAGLVQARQHFAEMGIALSIKRSEGEIHLDKKGDISGVVNTPSGPTALQDFIKSNAAAGSLTLMATPNIDLGIYASSGTKIVNGVPLWTLLGSESGPKDAEHEMAHSFGNTLGDNKSEAANAIADYAWFVNRTQSDMGLGFKPWFVREIREGAAELEDKDKGH